MESALTARDRVGVQDFVLLENFTSEAAFIENLRKRFKENLIYVSGTGTVTRLSLSDLGVFAARDEPGLALQRGLEVLVAAPAPWGWGAGFDGSRDSLQCPC